MKKPQWRKIYDHMLKGHSITRLQALHKFGCFELSRRICDIEKHMRKVRSGFDIYKKFITTTDGKRVMKYWID